MSRDGPPPLASRSATIAAEIPEPMMQMSVSIMVRTDESWCCESDLTGGGRGGRGGRGGNKDSFVIPSEARDLLVGIGEHRNAYALAWISCPNADERRHHAGTSRTKIS